LTYPNATAAVLAAINRVVLGGLVGAPGSVPLAVVTAEVFGCNNVTCGRETDTEVIEIQR
jgi:hypothetical protein